MVVRIDDYKIKEVTNEEVIKKWLYIYKGSKEEQDFLASTKDDQQRILKTKKFKKRAKIYRKRLASISWFMKTLKQEIAVRANKEDNVTGHFWEGRFKSIPINTNEGYEKLMHTMAYVALNPIRAAMADDPEYAHYTGLYKRLKIKKIEEQIKKEKQKLTKCNTKYNTDIQKDKVKKEELEYKIKEKEKEIIKVKGLPGFINCYKELINTEQNKFKFTIPFTFK
jgi:hypothetical protein